MALVSCPECQKEISDTVPQCIHCGYQLVAIEQSAHHPIHRKKPTKLFGALLIIGVLLVFSWVGWQQYQEYMYRKSVYEVTSLMLSDLVIAGGQADLVVAVWHDAIFRDYNESTKEYVTSDIAGYLDFNAALSLLSLDENVIRQQKSLLDNKDIVQQRMLSLDVPYSYQDAHKNVVLLNVLYQKMITLAYSPSGSYNSYVEEVRDTSSQIIDVVRQINIEIPAVES